MIWKSDLSDKIECNFLPSSSCVSSTIWMHYMDADKAYWGKARQELHKNAMLNESWKQHPMKQQLYSHLPPISKTIEIRQARYVGFCWKSKDKFTCPPMDSCTRTYHCWPTNKNLHKTALYGHRCSLEDLPEAIDYRDKWWKRVREIFASSMT